MLLKLWLRETGANRGGNCLQLAQLGFQELAVANPRSLTILPSLFYPFLELTALLPLFKVVNGGTRHNVFNPCREQSCCAYA